MKALKLTNAQLEDIYFENSERFELIGVGEWEQDHKTQSCSFTFTDTTTGLMYEGFAGRSGSPFTDWTYDSKIYEESYILKPVEEVKVVITEIQEVGDSKITETETVEEV